MKPFSYLVRVPSTYTSENAKTVNPQWENVLVKWKATGIYIGSYAFPGESYVVAGADAAYKKGSVVCEGLRVVSHVVLLAGDIKAALAQAQEIPILKYGGTVEIREVMIRRAAEQ